uniref:Uncharacterized protein n=1 Tax=Romanomermis culicivorax TaxID=13658 RepID=A0A915J8J5_ROMCU
MKDKDTTSTSDPEISDINDYFLNNFWDLIEIFFFEPHKTLGKRCASAPKNRISPLTSRFRYAYGHHNI